MMKYSRVLLLCILVLGLSSCETDDTEYWLSGTWAGQVGARDASFIFNENRTGSYRIEGAGAHDPRSSGGTACQKVRHPLAGGGIAAGEGVGRRLQLPLEGNSCKGMV